MAKFSVPVNIRGVVHQREVEAENAIEAVAHLTPESPTTDKPAPAAPAAAVQLTSNPVRAIRTRTG